MVKFSTWMEVVKINLLENKVQSWQNTEWELLLAKVSHCLLTSFVNFFALLFLRILHQSEFL